MRRFLLRPSIWIAAITALAYWDETALNGTFVYDDGGSVKTNVVVNGNRPWHEVWIRDYWGTLMSEPQSHKSFRPITTLSFRGNWILAERQKNKNNDNSDTAQPSEEVDTFGFHIVNLILHTIVTALVTEAASFVFIGGDDASSPQNHLFDATIPRMITGLIFGLHPVHVEAVTNITSRGELLMSLFFLLAFLTYASNLPSNAAYASGKLSFSFQRTISIYVLPWMFMTLSVFSKEQGATTLATLLAYDFIHNYSSVKDFFGQMFSKANRACEWAFLRRATALFLQSVIVAGWRYWLNGESTPDFIYDQNPAGFSKDRFTRVFSVSWVYCLYVRDVLYPAYLCPDWSGISIDLITNWRDIRILGVLALWSCAASCVYALLFGSSTKASEPRSSGGSRRIVLMAFFAFLFSPFLLSSNLLVVVGLMKADRVIYLPLFGFALLEALLLKVLFFSSPPTGGTSTTASNATMLSKRYLAGYVLFMLQTTLFTAKLHERNVAWSSPVALWVAAYGINSRSRHTIYNCGYELSLKLRYAEAEQVLRPIGSPYVEGPSNTFVYAMVLYNLKRCDEAMLFIDDALEVVEDKRRTGGVRNTESSLARVRSNLLVAQGFCTDDLTEAGRIMYSAVQADPTNQYAVEQATRMASHIEKTKELYAQQARLGLA
jgi:protein O-mannosyl-transferase